MESLAPIKIGADPEIVFKDSLGRIIESPSGSVLGYKGKELVFPFGMTSKDGGAGEYTVEPTTHLDTFIDRHHKGLRKLEELSGYSISNAVSHRFSSLTEESSILGCSPSVNNYLKGSLKASRPDDLLAQGIFLVCCGGHIHKDSLPEHLELGVRWDDALLGIPAVLEDTDTDRRLMYGRAGDIRVKSYGYEYRTLSNYWVHSVSTIAKVFRRAQRASSLARQGIPVPISDKMLQGIINNSDREYAQMVLNNELKQYHIA